MTQSYGCQCRRCCRRYKVDFILPDHIWAKIAGGANLLCGRCIADRLESLDEYDYWYMTKENYA